MKQYLDLLKDIYTNGHTSSNRTDVRTRALFGRQIRFNLNEGFPLLTTKRVAIAPIIEELLWFLRGETNVKTLGCKIWNEWANPQGDLGPIYGRQWRNWGGHFDQIGNLIRRLKADPDSRRHVISAWNVADLPKMAMAPCHVMAQFDVTNDRLSCQMYQRSADVFLGVPFNIASYALLTMMIAQVCGFKLGEFIHTFGDVHIYVNHFKQVQEQMHRKPMPLPKMTLAGHIMDIDDFRREHFTLTGYNSWAPLPGKIAV